MEPNKLPEGRKPLPDEWFAERAQMQERIKELETLLWASDYDAKEAETMEYMQHWEGRAERAEAKLAKAVRLISEKPILATYEDDVQWQKYVIAELTGGKDE